MSAKYFPLIQNVLRGAATISCGLFIVVSYAQARGSNPVIAFGIYNQMIQVIWSSFLLLGLSAVMTGMKPKISL